MVSRTLVAVLLLTACATPPPAKQVFAPPRPAPAPSSVAPEPEDAGSVSQQAVEPRSAARPTSGSVPAAGDSVVLRVDGEAVGVSELLALWWHRAPAEVRAHLAVILDHKLGLLEGKRLGIVLSPEAIDAAVIAVRSEMEAQLAENKPGTTLEEYVSGRLGLDPARYLAFVRERQIQSMMLERVVRAWILSQERARIRVIIVTEEDEAAQVKEALDAGRPFDEVAAELSRDESATRGGQMAPIVRGADSLLSRLAFTTPKGGVFGPVEERGGILWLQVEDFPAPLQGLWADIAPAVEASLAAEPLDEAEREQWWRFTAQRHEVDLGPFYSLVGEPAPRR